MRLVIIRQLECQAAAAVSFATGVTIPPAASNFLGKVTTIASKERLPVRHVTVGYDFAYAGMSAVARVFSQWGVGAQALLPTFQLR